MINIRFAGKKMKTITVKKGEIGWLARFDNEYPKQWIPTAYTRSASFEYVKEQLEKYPDNAGYTVIAL